MRPRAEIAGEFPRDWWSLSSYTARWDARSSTGVTAAASRSPRPPVKSAPLATTADKQTADLPEIIMAFVSASPAAVQHRGAARRPQRRRVGRSPPCPWDGLHDGVRSAKTGVARHLYANAAA